MPRIGTIAAAGAALALSIVATPLSAGATAHPTGSATSAVKDVVLTVGVNETSRNVSWLSTDAADRCVQLSVHGRHTKPVTVAAYQSGAATDAPNTYFHATLSGLKPSTTYEYRVGDCRSDWTAPYTLATRDRGSFDFLLMGDPQLGANADGTINGWPGWQNTLDTATARFPRTDFIVSAGDQVNSYTNSAQSSEWDAFLRPSQLSRIALAPTVGNHDNASGTGTQYAEHLATPNASALGATATGNGDYWYTYNGALFMDVNTNSLDLAAHRTFLENAIKANPRATWSIVVFHQAPFSSADHPNDSDVVYLRTSFAPILSELGVDLVLNGHDHDYARSYLMNGSTPVAGTGGSTVKAGKGDVLYIATNSASGGKFYGLTGPYPWVAVANQEQVPNYSDVSVTGSRITVTTFRTSDDTVVDKVTLRR